MVSWLVRINHVGMKNVSMTIKEIKTENDYYFNKIVKNF